MRKGIISVFAIGLLFVLASAQAGTVYTDLPSFMAQLQPGYYLETFDGIGLGLLGVTLGFSDGTYSYTASAPAPHELFGQYAPSSVTDRVLSNNTATDTIRFDFTSANVTAVGGYFFPTNILYELIPGNTVLTLSDGTVVALMDGTPASFVGFTTDPGVWITSLTVDAVDTPGDPPVYRWPTVNDLYVGTAIPEPTTGALLAGGVLLLAALARRRKKA